VKIKNFILFSFDKLSPIIMENFLIQFENKGHTPIHMYIYVEKHFSLTVLLLPLSERGGWNKLYSKRQDLFTRYLFLRGNKMSMTTHYVLIVFQKNLQIVKGQTVFIK